MVTTGPAEESESDGEEMERRVIRERASRPRTFTETAAQVIGKSVIQLYAVRSINPQINAVWLTSRCIQNQ